MVEQRSPYNLEGRMAAVTGRLRAARARWLRVTLGAGLLWIWALGALGLLLLTIAPMAWDLPALAVSLPMWVVLAVAVAASVWMIHRTVRSWPGALELALKVGEQNPEVGTRLLAGLELWGRRGDRKHGYSRALIDAVAENTWRVASDVDFGPVVPSRALVRSVQVFAVSMIGWVVLVLAAPDGIVSSWRQFPVALTGERIPLIEVEPGHCEIPAGEPLSIRAAVKAPGIPEATLVHNRDGQGWRTVSMRGDAAVSPPGETRFLHAFSRIERPFRYAVLSGKAASDTFRVGIRARPKVTQIRVDYDYPEYTGLADRRGVEGEGRITALKGTRASVWVEASRVLGDAEFVVDETDTIPGWIEEGAPREATGTIPVLRDGRYRIRVADEDGYRSDREDQYSVTCLPDEVPLVRLVSPSVEATLPPDMSVTLRGVAHDDYGFSRVLLHFFRSEGDEPETARISGPVRTKEYELDYVWSVDDLGLMPGDVLTYYVEVWDNDAISGPKRAATDLHVLRFPSMIEIFSQADQLEEEEIVELKDVYDEEEFLGERLKEISRDLKREKDLSWETKKEIERTAEAQEQINERMEQVAQGLDEAAEILEQNELVSMEIMEKMAQLRDLVEEVATPEMREAMQKLREALEQLDREEIEKALQEFEISQEDLLERLERSIELLERLRIERRLEELAEVAEDLADRQTDLATEAGRTDADSLPNLAGREKRIAEETAALEKEIAKTAEMAEELEPEASAALESMAGAMEEDELVARLESARRALSGKSPSAPTLTEQRAEDMRRVAEELRMSQNLLSMQKRRELAEAIERLTHDLVWFSFEEEGIAKEVRTLRARDLEARREVADRQVSLKTSASQLMQRLRELARMTYLVSPEAGRSLGKALEHMEAAARVLESGNTTPADREGMAAMALLNRAVLALMESQQCMSSCSSPMGFKDMLQKMQQMSCQQSGLNQATQDLLSQMGQGGGLPMEARAQMARLAAEQRALQKTAETLAGEMGDQPGILGRMEGITSEMEKVIRDLESMGLRAETVDRQKRILSRLLDAQKSVRRRDYARVRLSRVGAERGQISPPELPDEVGRTPAEIREDLLKAVGDAYPLRYESLIRSYFRELAREGVEESSQQRAQ